MEKKSVAIAKKTQTFKQEYSIVLTSLKIIVKWFVSFSIKLFNFMILIVKKFIDISMKLFERIIK